MSFFRQLAANLKIAKGHTVMGEPLAAGQFDVAASIYSHTVDNAAEGAPVSFCRTVSRSSRSCCGPTAPV
jgi:iron(III) transport system substrate-binding protein